MVKQIIQHIITISVALFFSCGPNIINYDEAVSNLLFPSSVEAPSGNDALSASTNQSDKDEEKSPKLDPLSGAAYIKPPQINNYGTVTLSYPVDVPAGRHGVQPSVGLSYSSSGGDGLVGIGWSLSTGLGVISRTSQNGELYYDYRDTFTYNGQRLVKVEGESGSENGTYRQEIESGFSRFVLTDAESGGVWRVYDKAGTVTVFGLTHESRIYKPDDETKTYIWNFCRSTDLNGNYMAAEYDASEYPENHILYLKEIRYTGNSSEGHEANQYIRFHYKDRDEKYVSKAPGFIMRMDRLLDSIEVGWDDPMGIFGISTELWRYVMVYENSEDSGRPLLFTVESNHNTTKPEFLYQPAVHNFIWSIIANPDADDPELNPDATQYFEGDFNGDGLSDMVFFNPETGDWKAAEGRREGGYNFKIYGNRFQGYDGPSKIQWFKGNVTGDYNGDGRSDIAFYLTETREFWVAEHDGVVFQFKNYGRLSAAGLDIFACEWFPGDYDGNGLSDAVLFNESNGAWYLMRNMGGRFEFLKFSQHFKNIFRNDYNPGSNMDSPSTADDSPYGLDRGKVHFLNGDYNGDGRTDISIYDQRDGKWWVAENYRVQDNGQYQNGAMFELRWKLYKIFTAPESALFGHDRFSGDFNGDGFSDFLLFDKDSGEWLIGETQDGTIRFRIFSRVPQFKGITRWLQGDFNGDGRTDIGFFCADDGNFWIGEATNGGFRYRIYNNLSYGPDPGRVLRTPMPLDEVTITNDSRAVSSTGSTALIDYQFNGNYNTDRGERCFPGYFKSNAGTPIPGVLFFARYYDHRENILLYKGQGDTTIEEVPLAVDLEAEGNLILNNGKPIQAGTLQGIAYYTRESGNHYFKVIANNGSWQNTTVASFTDESIKDFDANKSLHFLGDFDGNASTKEVLALNDLRDGGPRWALVAGSSVTTITMQLPSGLSDDIFATMRNNRGSFRFFNGRFIGSSGPEQILMVDMHAADHKWYLGTLGSGSITFTAISEASSVIFPSGWKEGQSRVMEDGSLLLWRVVDDRYIFTRIIISNSGGYSVSLVTMASLASNVIFKEEFAHIDNGTYKSPLVHTDEGIKRVRFNGTRCELIDPGAMTTVKIDRKDLTDSDDFYVFRWIQGDYNGDGKTDIGIFHLKERNWYFAMTSGTVPDLISQVNNGIGGNYTFEYTNSTSFDNTGEDGIPHLPMNYKVCTRLTVNDGFNREIVTTYEYSKGYAFSAFINGKKETDYFGFCEFTVRDAVGSATTNWYNNVPYDDFRMNRALAGAIRESVFQGSDGKEYTRTQYDYTIRVIVPSGAPPLPWGDELPVQSYLIEPTAVRKLINNVLVETRTSSIELTPGIYEMTAKTESVTDHFTDSVHQPVTAISYSRFENIASTNEMRLEYKRNFSGSSHETTTGYEYDNRGNVIRETLRYTGSGLPAVRDRIMEYDYDGYGNRERERNVSGTPARVMEKTFDPRLHQFIVEERSLGNHITLRTQYEINYASAFGGINRKIDPNDASTYFEYDAYGRLTRQSADTENGREILSDYSYNEQFPLSGKVIQNTGSASGGTPVEMRIFADGMGRSLHTVRSAMAQSGRRYVKTGKLVYDPVGRVIRKSQSGWAGDDEIDVYRESDREKNPTITEYDSSGRMKKVILPPGFSGEAETSVSYTYNDPWETIETHSVGRSKSTLKNGRSQVLYVEDSGRGDDGRSVDAKIGFAYDIAGNRVKKMDLNGASMSLDIPSNLFTPNVKDTSGNNVACWRYNAFGQITDSSDPDLGYTGITYNSFGDIASRTDALDRTVTMDYDRLGRIVRKDLPGLEGAVVYRYDSLAGCDYALGRMVSINDPAQNKQFSYDPLGRVKRETRTVKGAGRTRYVTTFEYDLMDHKLRINYPADAKTNSAMSVSYHYCPMGVTAVEIDNGSMQKQIVQDVVYNEFGQMTELHRGNTTVTYYTYDIKGRLENLLTTAQHNGQTWKVQDLKYEFKVDNSISAVENTPDVAFDGACQTLARYEYSYDGLNRLVHARGSYDKTRTVPSPGEGDPLNPVDGPITKKFELGYDYSRNGNLTAKTIYDTETGTVDDAWSYNYGNHAATRIETTKAGLRYQMTYDAAGNMISQVDHSNNIAKKMAYDSYNRIRKVTNQHNGRLMGQYWYDDQGFRVRRKARYMDNGEERNVEVVQPSMYFGVEISRDNLGIIHPKAGFSVNHIYLNGVRIAAALPDGTAQYYLTDQVDSVKVVTNDSGLVVTSHEYMPFGEDWITEGDTKNAPKYNSQELDKESGYYFYNARHYDPEIGRFVTADSIVPYQTNTQSWNRFSYCSNNPIIYKDPTGHVQVTQDQARTGDVMLRRDGGLNQAKEDKAGIFDKLSNLVHQKIRDTGQSHGHAAIVKEKIFDDNGKMIGVQVVDIVGGNPVTRKITEQGSATLGKDGKWGKMDKYETLKQYDFFRVGTVEEGKKAIERLESKAGQKMKYDLASLFNSIGMFNGGNSSLHSYSEKDNKMTCTEAVNWAYSDAKTVGEQGAVGKFGKVFLTVPDQIYKEQEKYDINGNIRPGVGGYDRRELESKYNNDVEKVNKQRMNDYN